MPSDWDDYTLDIKLLKHYQSIMGVRIRTVSTLRLDVVYHISVLAQGTTRTVKVVKSAYRVMGYQSWDPHSTMLTYSRTIALRSRYVQTT